MIFVASWYRCIFDDFPIYISRSYSWNVNWISCMTCVKFPNILNINFSIYGKPMQMRYRENRNSFPMVFTFADTCTHSQMHGALFSNVLSLLHSVCIYFVERTLAHIKIDLRFYLCTFENTFVYIALTLDLKLEIDKFSCNWWFFVFNLSLIR